MSRRLSGQQAASVGSWSGPLTARWVRAVSIWPESAPAPSCTRSERSGGEASARCGASAHGGGDEMADLKAIIGGTLIDGTGAEPVTDATVLVRDGRIEAAGESASVEMPEGAKVIDASGLTVMPGLIEGHAHVGGSTKDEQVLRISLQRGITTVCSVSANVKGIALRDGIEAGHVRGCARLIAGCIVTPTNGHVRFRDADGPWEVRKAVREMVEAGADFIKTAASGGFAGQHEICSMQNYTPEELCALADEAHAWHVPVVVHCHTQPGLNNAIEAGIDQIHHGAFIDEEAVRGILEADLWYMPTLAVTCQRNIDAKQDRPWETEEMTQAQPIHREGVRLSSEIGVKLCVGTDYPGTGKTWKIGDRTIYELMELEQCGLSRMDALVAATRTNAEAYRLDDLGTLESGKRADMVLLDGDPLAGFDAVYDHHNVKLVLKDGTVEFADGEFMRHYTLREPQPPGRPAYEDHDGPEARQ
ncbi:MAG: amidohydrolase family protein [Armatimonadia bacterium]|nr:amidohydrolase family protein [Armatimonadia bacterium]